MVNQIRLAPWHATGTKVTGLSLREALEATGLDYLVSRAPVFTRKGDEYCLVPRREAIVANDRVIGIVSPQYNIVQNSDVFSCLDILKNYDIKVETMGHTPDYRMVWASAVLPDSIHIDAKDMVQKYILVSSRHDGTGTVEMMFTPVRVACVNTLSIARQRSTFRMCVAHRAQAQEKVRGFAETLETMIYEYRKIATRYLLMADTPVDAARDYFTPLASRLFPESAPDPRDTSRTLYPQHDAVLNWTYLLRASPSIPAGNSLWSAYNAVTEHIDHYSFTKNVGPQTRMNQLVFGLRARQKAVAFTVAQAIAHH